MDKCKTVLNRGERKSQNFSGISKVAVRTNEQAGQKKYKAALRVAERTLRENDLYERQDS